MVIKMTNNTREKITRMLWSEFNSVNSDAEKINLLIRRATVLGCPFVAEQMRLLLRNN